MSTKIINTPNLLQGLTGINWVKNSDGTWSQT